MVILWVGSVHVLVCSDSHTGPVLFNHEASAVQIMRRSSSDNVCGPVQIMHRSSSETKLAHTVDALC